MKRVTVITEKDGKRLAAAFADGRAVSLSVEDPADPPLAGCVFTARVQHRVGNLDACFAEIRPGEMAFLEVHGAPPAPGSVVTVQVTADRKGDKNARVSQKLVLSDSLAVLQSGMSHVGVSNKITDEAVRTRLHELADAYMSPEYGFILRTAAAAAPKEALKAQLAALAARYENCRRGQYLQPYSLLDTPDPAWLSSARDAILRADALGEDLPEIVTDLPAVAEACRSRLPEHLQACVRVYERTDIALYRVYGFDKVLSEATARRVWLPCGGNLVIDRTEAMTVIDVNSAKSVKGKKTKAENTLKVDMEAATEAARQLRLRNLSGIILIDFIDPAAPEDEEELIRHLCRELGKDPVTVEFVEMTRLHFAVLTRKRVSAPLSEMLAGLSGKEA